MIYYEPKWGDITNAPSIGGISTSTRIGTDGVDKVYDTAVRYCFYKGEFYDSHYLGSTNATIAYFRATTMQFETKAQVPFIQINCRATEDVIYQTNQTNPSTVQLESTVATSTVTFETVGTITMLALLGFSFAVIVGAIVKKVT